MKAYRVGAHWGVTVVETDTHETPNEQGRRPGDRLICLATSPEGAEYIVTALNLAEPGAE